LKMPANRRLCLIRYTHKNIEMRRIFLAVSAARLRLIN
jgi:hypothetical protein